MFVVEVARGADCTATTQITELINDNRVSNNITLNNITEYVELNQSNTNGNEEVLVHPPPISSDEDVLTVDEDGAVSMSSPKLNGFDDAKAMVKASSINTGLSQSDLSISSSTGSNQGYCYGSQEAYTVDPKGYQSNSPLRSHIEIIASESLKGATDTEEQIEPDDIETDVDGIADEQTPDECHGDDQKANENGSPAIQANNIPLEPECVPVENGKCVKDGPVVDEPTTSGDGNDNFDSLLNLPAPPTCDEIKQLHEITLLESNTFESLPPPPPETLPDNATILNGQS